MQLKLAIKKGARQGETLEIENFPAVFGRGNECTHQFKELGVSKRHFTIEYDQGRFQIKDLKSISGTYVNKKKLVETTILNSQDSIMAGQLIFEVILPEAETSMCLPLSAVKVDKKTREMYKQKRKQGKEEEEIPLQHKLPGTELTTLSDSIKKIGALSLPIIEKKTEVKVPQPDAEQSSPSSSETAETTASPGAQPPAPTAPPLVQSPALAEPTGAQSPTPAAPPDAQPPVAPPEPAPEQPAPEKLPVTESPVVATAPAPQQSTEPTPSVAEKPDAQVSGSASHHRKPVMQVAKVMDDNVDKADSASTAKEASHKAMVKRRVDPKFTLILGPTKEKLEHSQRALKIIYEILQRCNSENNQQSLLTGLLQSLFKALNAHRGAVVISNPDGSYQNVISLHESGSQKEFTISQTILKDVLYKGISAIFSASGNDNRYSHSDSLRLQKVHSSICAPLMSGEKVCGAIYLDRLHTKAMSFNNEDLELLAAIGIQVGSTLEKSMLIEALQETNSHLSTILHSFPPASRPIDLLNLYTDFQTPLKNIAEQIAQQSGRNMFIALVRLLSKELDADHVFVGEWIEYKQEIKILALAHNGELIENFCYPLSGAPCENVIGKSVSYYLGDVEEVFPDCKLISQTKAQSYIGIPLISLSGNPLGVFAALAGKPLQEDSNIELALNTFALRTAMELEQSRVETDSRQLSGTIQRNADQIKRSEKALWKQTRILQSILINVDNGILVVDENGNFLMCNPSAEEILGGPYQQGSRNSVVQLTNFAEENWTQKHGIYQADMKTPYPVDKFPLTRVIRGETVDTEQIYLKHSHEAPGIWISFSATALQDEMGKIQGGIAILRNITENKRDQEKEFAIAEQIQQQVLLAPPAVQMPEIEIGTLHLPASTINGTFYDFFHNRDQQLDFVMGEISGQGIPVTLLAATAKNQFLHNINYLLAGDKNASLEQIVTLAHQNISAQFTATQSHIRFCYARFDMTSNKTQLINCGYGKIMRLCTSTGDCKMLDSESNSPGLQQIAIDIEPGDIYIFCSQTDNSFYEQLSEFIFENQQLAVDDFMAELKQSAADFQFTLIMFKIAGAEQPAADQESESLDHIELEVPGDTSSHTIIRSFIKDFCCELPDEAFAIEQAKQFELAGGQAVTDILKRRDHDEAQQFLVSGDIYPEGLVVCIYYHGASIDSPASNQRIKSYVDKIEHFHDEEKNCITLHKNFIHPIEKA